MIPAKVVTVFSGKMQGMCQTCIMYILLRFSSFFFSNVLFQISGAFVPVTMEGNIIVDGILASCYGITDHDLAHILLSPMRFIPGIMEWIYGQEDGAQGYMNIIRWVGSLVVPDSIWYDGINN